MLFFQIAFARALHFIPPAPCCVTNCSSSEWSPFYPVIGLVSGTNSQNTLAVAGVGDLFRMPVIGAVSTSELLHNPVRRRTNILPCTMTYELRDHQLIKIR